jgi:hypothetical protein
MKKFVTKTELLKAVIFTRRRSVFKARRFMKQRTKPAITHSSQTPRLVNVRDYNRDWQRTGPYVYTMLLPENSVI